jgi:hypothetical protein
MGLIHQQQLIAQISPPADAQLSEQLVREFVSLEGRFIQRDWEPAELDAGQFAEILSRVLYHLDSGILSRGKDIGECLGHVEDDSKGPHQIQPRSTGLHIARVLRCVYKFRSARGAIHISPTYTANHLDSRFMIECARWCMAETIRWLAGGKPSHDDAARIIRELLQFEVPAVGRYGDRVIVQRTDLSAIEEVLVMLHYAGEEGISRRELGKSVQQPAPRVTEAIQELTALDCREVIEVDGRFRLTDLGSRRVRTDLADRLLVQ